MSLETYSEFQNAAASEKITLVILEAARRLMGFSLYDGSVYVLEEFDFAKIVSMEMSGVELTEVTSIPAILAGNFYNDRVNKKLYLRTSDSAHPNGKFIVCTFQMFFSDVVVAAPHDLADGFEVTWLPYLKSTSEFGVDLDNVNLLGFAIEGSGKVTFRNQQEFWDPIFDNYYFENKSCYVYSWNRNIHITDATLLFRGRVTQKSYSSTEVSFSLKDLINALRSLVPLSDISEFPGVLVPTSVETAKQRLLLGYANGIRPVNIDQSFQTGGYEVAGTVAVTSGSATVTGTGTTFLSLLSPGDEVLIGEDEETYTVKTVDTNLALTLSQNYSGGTDAVTTLTIINTKEGKRYTNRSFLIAGHALREPSTTITKIYSLSVFEVSDVTDFLAGEPVSVNGENGIIRRVSGNRVTLEQAIVAIAIGDTIVVTSVRNVYLDTTLLTNIRDYTYDAETATLELDPLAEFNVAQTRSLTGSIAFVSGSRNITGTATFFKTELKPGDWIRRSNESTWSEVLEVTTDTAAVLREVCTYNSTGAALFKNPNVYKEGSSTLSCDCLGVTDDGETSGEFVNNSPRVVKFLLGEVGLGDDIDEASFEEAEEIGAPLIGLAIPEGFQDSRAPVVREIINLMNQSCFGSVYQNQDFNLAYSILSPTKPPSMDIFRECDVLNIAIQSDSGNLTKKIYVEYGSMEYDKDSGEKSVSRVSRTSDTAQYLAKTDKESTIKTCLLTEAAAQISANRWSLLLELATSIVKVDTKMQGAALNINDKVHLKHEKLYSRLGSSSNQKIGAISMLRKTASTVKFEVSDLSNAFSRCATITDDDAEEFSEASEEDKNLNGYITDQYGMIDNDQETFGLNIIW